MNDTDEQLWSRCRAGSQDAWRALVERHLPRVLGVAVRVLGRRDEAEEIAQEVFLKVHERPTAYDPQRGSFGSWVTTVARNASLDRYRRTREERTRGGALPASVASPDPSPGALVERREAREAVLAGLLSLPPELREPIVLCDLQGASYEDASEAMDVPLGTLKSRLHRARLELARRLRRG